MSACGVRLLAVAAVDPECDGPVVGEGDFHVRTEDSLGHGFAELLAERFAEGFVKWLGKVWVGGFQKRGAIAFLRRGVEGELADDKDVSAGFEDRAVHFSFVIFEDAEAGDLSCQPIDVAVVIDFLDAEKDEVAMRNEGMD